MVLVSSSPEITLSSLTSYCLNILSWFFYMYSLYACNYYTVFLVRPFPSLNFSKAFKRFSSPIMSGSTLAHSHVPTFGSPSLGLKVVYLEQWSLKHRFGAGGFSSSFFSEPSVYYSSDAFGFGGEPFVPLHTVQVEGQEQYSRGFSVEILSNDEAHPKSTFD